MQLSVSTSTASRAAAVLLASAALVVATLTAPAGSTVTATADPCHEPAAHGEQAAPASARGGHGLDHRAITASEQALVETRTAALLATQRSTGTEKRIRVPVRVHVMARRDGTGNVPRRRIDRQVSVMNQHFAGAESQAAASTRFRFVLKGVDRYRNDRWHRDGRSKKYRKATRAGAAKTLNVWVVGFDYLGIATFPWDYTKRPGVDGVRVDYRSLPGGSRANYDQGKTATHEVGHWLGLYHTFQGGCSETNDEVADTPAQRDYTIGCPPDATDTCPLREGTDPIHNYMDYSYDDCMDQFTPGQKRRMRQMWRAYRG